MKTKQCSKCSKIKLVSEFSKDKYTNDRLCPQCRKCRQAYRQSPRGKITSARGCKKYRQTEKGKAADTKGQKKYRKTEKGKATHNRVGKKYRNTLEGNLCGRFHNMNHRCNDPGAIGYKNYGAKGVKNLFRSFGTFFIHVTIDLGFDTYGKIKGLEIHRTKNHYCANGIEFLTRAEHAAKHKEMRNQKRNKKNKEI